MENLQNIFYEMQPQIMEATQQVIETEGDGKKKLILMGGLLVAFVVIFIVVSKKMKKK